MELGGHSWPAMKSSRRQLSPRLCESFVFLSGCQKSSRRIAVRREQTDTPCFLSPKWAREGCGARMKTAAGFRSTGPRRRASSITLLVPLGCNYELKMFRKVPEHERTAITVGHQVFLLVSGISDISHLFRGLQGFEPLCSTMQRSILHCSPQGEHGAGSLVLDGQSDMVHEETRIDNATITFALL